MSDSKKRGWKGYILEFIMLFLAVSLGFMADNFREKKSERNKEKEYIQSMIEDVEEDRANITEAITMNTQRAQFLDSLLKQSYHFKGSEKEIVDLNQNFVHVLLHPEFFTSAELTIQQLKNAGGMRLIKSKSSINEILRYDTQIKKIENQQLYYENYQNRAIENGVEIFNINEIVSSLTNPNINTKTIDYNLLNDKQSDLKVFGNNVAMYKGVIEFYVRLLERTNEQGELLVETLKSEYKLK